MSLPTKQMVHIDPVLSDIASNWIIGDAIGANYFAAERLFPLVQTNEISAIIAQYDRRDLYRAREVRPRAPATESQGIGYRVQAEQRYLCKEWAVHKDVSDEERAYTQSPFAADRDATSVVTQLLQLKREELIAAAAFGVGIWGNDVLGVAGVPAANQVRQWSDYITPSTPAQDIDWWRTWMELATGGIRPSKLAVGMHVWNALKNHPALIARYVQTAPGGIPVATANQVASWLEIDEIIVLRSVQNIGPEGGQWQGQYIFPGNAALLYYTPSAPSLTAPSAGYTFGWTGGGHQGFTIAMERFRLANDAKGDRIVGNFHFDTMVVENVLGVYFTNLAAGLNQVVI